MENSVSKYGKKITAIVEAAKDQLTKDPNYKLTEQEKFSIAVFAGVPTKSKMRGNNLIIVTELCDVHWDKNKKIFMVFQNGKKIRH